MSEAIAPPALQAAEAPMERLDRRVIGYWRVSGFLGFVFAAGLLTVGVLVVREHAAARARLAQTVAFAGAGLLLAWTLVAPFLAWARWRFAIGTELLLLRRGILWHEERAIPLSRLQHVDLTRGPVERAFGLATVVMFTAGTEGASFRLPGLAAPRATEVRDHILRMRGDDVV